MGSSWSGLDAETVCCGPDRDDGTARDAEMEPGSVSASSPFAMHLHPRDLNFTKAFMTTTETGRVAAQPDKHFFSADGADEAKFFGTELATIEPRVFSPEVDFKIEAGGGALIHQFAARGNMIAIRALLDRRDKGISPHCAHSHFDDVNLADGFGRTALHFAAANGHLETARGLILCKADVFLRTHDGKMPLHLAAENEHSDLVAFLGSQLRQTSICAGSSSLEEMKRAMALHRQHRLDHTRHNLAKAAGLGLGSKSPPCKQGMTAEDEEPWRTKDTLEYTRVAQQQILQHLRTQSGGPRGSEVRVGIM